MQDAKRGFSVAMGVATSWFQESLRGVYYFFNAVHPSLEASRVTGSAVLVTPASAVLVQWLYSATDTRVVQC